MTWVNLIKFPKLMNLQTPPLQTPYKIKENFGTSQIHGNHMNLKVCSLIAKKKRGFSPTTILSAQFSSNSNLKLCIIYWLYILYRWSFERSRLLFFLLPLSYVNFVIFLISLSDIPSNGFERPWHVSILRRLRDYFARQT